MVDTVIIVIFAVNLHSQNYLFILHFVLKLFYHSALLNSPENGKAEKVIIVIHIGGLIFIKCKNQRR